MHPLKIVLIVLSVIILFIAATIVSCTAQLVHGVSDMAEQAATNVQTAVEDTQRSMIIQPDAITLRSKLIPDADSSHEYNAEIGIGQQLANALGIMLEAHAPAVEATKTETNPDGSSNVAWHYENSFGVSTGSGDSVSISGSGGKNIIRTAQSRYESVSVTSNNAGIKITLSYKEKPVTDEFMIGTKLVKVQFPAP